MENGVLLLSTSAEVPAVSVGKCALQCQCAPRAGCFHSFSEILGVFIRAEGFPF